MGRPRKLDGKKIAEIREILDTDFSADKAKLASQYKVHQRTLERALNELKEFTG